MKEGTQNNKTSPRLNKIERQWACLRMATLTCGRESAQAPDRLTSHRPAPAYMFKKLPCTVSRSARCKAKWTAASLGFQTWTLSLSVFSTYVPIRNRKHIVHCRNGRYSFTIFIRYTQQRDKTQSACQPRFNLPSILCFTLKWCFWMFTVSLHLRVRDSCGRFQRGTYRMPRHTEPSNW